MGISSVCIHGYHWLVLAVIVAGALKMGCSMLLALIHQSGYEQVMELDQPVEHQQPSSSQSKTSNDISPPCCDTLGLTQLVSGVHSCGLAEMGW